MTVVPIPMVPWTPNVQPAMPGTWAVSWSNCRGEMPPNCSSMAASQSCPYSRGVSTRRSRFAPNVRGARHRGHRDRQAQHRAAHRDGCPAAAGVEREPDPR